MPSIPQELAMASCCSVGFLKSGRCPLSLTLFSQLHLLMIWSRVCYCAVSSIYQRVACQFGQDQAHEMHLQKTSTIMIFQAIPPIGISCLMNCVWANLPSFRRTTPLQVVHCTKLQPSVEFSQMVGFLKMMKSC